MKDIVMFQIRKDLFRYWRLGTKLKDIIQENKLWNEKFISDQLKVVMDSYFAGESFYVN